MSTTTTITYGDIVRRFGRSMAYSFLVTVERLADIKHEIVSIDTDARLMKALEELNNTDRAGTTP